MSDDYKYVTSPLGSDFTSKNGEALDVAKAQSTLSHRLLSALGENEEDNGPNGFKFFEANLVSTKSVSFKESDISMLDPSFLASNKGRVGLEYNVIRFNRKHNIRSFDFIISYTQLTSFGSNMYKPTPITKQFKGTFLFSGCSNIKDKNTYEYIPFKLSARYESIGDMPGEDTSIDGLGNVKGGPALTFKYSKTDEYIYLYIQSVAPFRLVPLGGGKFADISLADNQGSFSAEVKPVRTVISDPSIGFTTTKPFERDPYIYCDINISIRDTTVSNSNSNLEVLPIIEAITSENAAVVEKNATLLTIAPTHNGEIATVGFSPIAYENLEIASDIAPISFGSRLLSSNMPEVSAISEKVKTLIKNAAISVGKIPFTIKESIRVRGLYNIKGDYLIDNAADSFGKILITEVGTYDAITDVFDIVSYVFDLENGKGKTTVGAMKVFFENVSDYLSTLTSGAKHAPSMKTTEPLSVVKSIAFQSSYDIDKFQDIAYVSSNLGNSAVDRAFVEISSGSINDEDVVVYFGKDNCVKVCSFKDYNMSNVVSTYLFSSLPTTLKDVVRITSIERYIKTGSYVYVIGTNLGLVFTVTLGDSNTPTISLGENPFIERLDFETRTVIGNEAVSGIFEVGNYLYFTGDNGSVALYDKVNSKYVLLPKYSFDRAFGGEEIEAIIDGPDFVLFKTESYLKSYSLTKKVWSSDLSSSALGPNIDLRTPFNGDGKDIQNLQFGDGCLGDVPIIQNGDFVYAMGVRSTDNLPIYRKLNIVTGKISRLDIPSVGNQVIRAKLVIIGNYIVSIGGAPAEYSATVTSDLVTYISVFDMLSESWISSGALNLNLENSSFEGSQVYRKLEEFYPTVVDGSIHIVKPRVRYLSTDANTGALTQSYAYESGRYVVSFADIFSTSSYTYVPFLENTEFSVFQEATVTYHPVSVSGKIIRGFVMIKSEGNTGYPVPAGELRYDLYYVAIDTEADGSGYVAENQIMGIDRNVIVFEYSGYAENAPVDGLANGSFYVYGTKVLMFILTKVIMVVDTSDMSTYKARSLSYTGTIPKGARDPSLVDPTVYLNVWERGLKTPENIQFIRKGEYIAFVGGTAYPTPEYFSLDTLSFLISPNYLNLDVSYFTPDISKSMKELVGPDYAMSSMSSVVVGSAMYIVATLAYLPDYNDPMIITRGVGDSPVIGRVLLLKYEENKPGKLALEFDLTDSFTTAISAVNFPEFVEVFELGGSLFMYAKRYRAPDSSTISISNRTMIQYTPSTKTCSIGQVDAGRVGFDSFVVVSPMKDEAYIIDTITARTEYPFMDGAAGLCAVSKIKVNADSSVTVSTMNNVMRNIVEPSNYSGISGYKASATYGQYAFIATIRSLYVVDTLAIANDALLSVGAGITKVFDFGRDESLRSISVSGDWLYVTGGLVGGITGADRLVPDTSVFKFHAPTLVQNFGKDELANPIEFSVSKPIVKYRNAFMVTKDETLVTVGDIVNPHVTTTLAGFDPMASIMSSALFETDVSKVGFTPSAYAVPIDTIPKTTLNLYQPRTMLAHFPQGDVLVVLGGRVSSNSDYGVTVDGYDVKKRVWFAGPSLPCALKNIIFQGNMIVGATEILESGIEQAYNSVLKLACSDFDGHVFTWEKETFGPTANTGSANTVMLSAKSQYARHHFPNGSVESYIIALSATGTISKGTASTDILRNIVNGSDITWESIPAIPYSSAYTYVVIHADVDEYGRFIVYLLNTVLKTIDVWVYVTSTWSLNRSFTSDEFTTADNLSVTSFENSNPTGLPSIFARTYISYTRADGVVMAIACDTSDVTNVLVEKVTVISLKDINSKIDVAEYCLAKNGDVFVKHNRSMAGMEYVPSGVCQMTANGLRNRSVILDTISPIPVNNGRIDVVESGITKSISSVSFISSIQLGDSIISLVADAGVMKYVVYSVSTDTYSALIPILYSDGTTTCPYTSGDEITLARIGSHLIGIPTVSSVARSAIVPGIIVTGIPTSSSESVTFEAGANLVFTNPADTVSYGKIKLAISSTDNSELSILCARQILTSSGASIYLADFLNKAEADFINPANTITFTFAIPTGYTGLGNTAALTSDPSICGYPTANESGNVSNEFAILSTLVSSGSGGKYGLLSVLTGKVSGLRNQMTIPVPSDNVSLSKVNEAIYVVPSTIDGVDYPILAIDLSGKLGVRPVRYVGYAEFAKASRCRTTSGNASTWIGGNGSLYNLALGSKIQVSQVREVKYPLYSSRNSTYAAFEDKLFEIVYDGSDYTLRTFSRETFEKIASVQMTFASGIAFTLDFASNVIIPSADGTKLIMIVGDRLSYIADITSGYISNGNLSKSTGMPYLKTFGVSSSREIAYLVNDSMSDVYKVDLNTGTISRSSFYSDFTVKAVLGMADDDTMLVCGRSKSYMTLGVFTAAMDITTGKVTLIGLENSNVLYSDAVLAAFESKDRRYLYTKSLSKCCVSVFTKHGEYIRTDAVDSVFGNADVAQTSIIPAYERFPALAVAISEKADTYIPITKLVEMKTAISDSSIPLSMSCTSRNAVGIKRLVENDIRVVGNYAISVVSTADQTLQLMKVSNVSTGKLVSSELTDKLVNVLFAVEYGKYIVYGCRQTSRVNATESHSLVMFDTLKNVSKTISLTPSEVASLSLANRINPSAIAIETAPVKSGALWYEGCIYLIGSDTLDYDTYNSAGPKPADSIVQIAFSHDNPELDITIDTLSLVISTVDVVGKGFLSAKVIRVTDNRAMILSGLSSASSFNTSITVLKATPSSATIGGLPSVHSYTPSSSRSMDSLHVDSIFLLANILFIVGTVGITPDILSTKVYQRKLYYCEIGPEGLAEFYIWPDRTSVIAHAFDSNLIAKNGNVANSSRATGYDPIFELELPTTYAASRITDSKFGDIAEDSNGKLVIRCEDHANMTLHSVPLGNKRANYELETYDIPVRVDGAMSVFTKEVKDNELVKNVASYYDDTYEVTIADSGYISIRVDGNVYKYSLDDTSIAFPFASAILPIVGAFGSRTNSVGETEARYYVFVDVNGNVSTFDRDTRAFVNVDGTVEVDIPYMSAELMIFPSKAVKEGSIGKRIWAYSSSNPYSTAITDDKLTVDDPALL